MDFAFWTRASVMLFIERECGVKMIVRTVGKLLQRCGFMPQKPIRRAYEHNPVAIQKWLDETLSDYRHTRCQRGGVGTLGR